MNEIVLKQNGQLTQDEKGVINDPIACLGNQITLEQVSTLRSYFKMLETYPSLKNLNSFLASFSEQFNTCPDSGCICDDIDYLKFYKTIEMSGFPGEPRLDIYHSLTGIQGSKQCAIKMFRMENLLDIPLKLGHLKHVVFGDKMDLFEFEASYNLFELIDGISWEISFLNMPRQCRIKLG